MIINMKYMIVKHFFIIYKIFIKFYIYYIIMNLISLINLNKGYKYIFINILSILLFSIFYYISDIYSVYEINDPWYYWLYFSSITQTTVGYGGIEVKGESGVNIMTFKSISIKILLFLQLLSVILINGYFIYI